MRARIVTIGFAWAHVLTATLVLYGVSAHRSNQLGMQAVTEVALFAAAGLSVATPWVRLLQTGLGAAVRVAFVASAFLLRSLALTVVGTPHTDRGAQFIGAGVSMCWAAAVVLFRMQFEVTIAAAARATD